MIMAKIRTAYDATGKGDIEMAVMRSKQLAEWIKGAEAERKEIGEKLGVVMDEHSCDAITIKGEQVARLDEYPTESLTGDLKKKFIKEHPRLWASFKTVGWMRRVTVG